MLVIHFFYLFIYLFIFVLFCFFWMQCVKQECTLVVSSKNETVCTLFLQTDYFNWSINSPRETAVDIVLDISENYRGNVYNMKFSVKLQPTNMEFVNPSRLRFSPDFPQKSFLELIYKSTCSELINAVMEYINFRSSASKLESITYKFTKNRTPSQ